jgi:hypothetical protein
MSRWNWMIGSFSEPPKNAHPAIRFVQLAVAVALLAGVIYLRLTAPPAYRESWNRTFVIAVAPLLSVLAYHFRWPAALTAGLRLLVLGWTFFVLFYLFYWSPVAHP